MMTIDGGVMKDADVIAGSYKVEIPFDYGAPSGFSGWWATLDLIYSEPGIAYVTIPATLPGALCPLTDGIHKHSIRFGAPRRLSDSTYPGLGITKADKQPGLWEQLPDQTGALGWTASVQHTSGGSLDWKPAATDACTDMYGAGCSPSGVGPRTSCNP